MTFHGYDSDGHPIYADATSNIGGEPPLSSTGLLSCANCGGTGSVDTGGMTPWGTGIEMPCPACNQKWDGLAAIGASWEKDSSLEKWFPITAKELADLKQRNAELKQLLKSVHEWFMEKSPENYNGCGLWIDVDITLREQDNEHQAKRPARKGT